MNQSFLSTRGFYPREKAVPGYFWGSWPSAGSQSRGGQTGSCSRADTPALPNRKNAHGEEKEKLTAQALDLSLKYHFVTPLTSMVVTKPEDNEDQTAIADKPGEGGPGMRVGMEARTRRPSSPQALGAQKKNGPGWRDPDSLKMGRSRGHRRKSGQELGRVLWRE